MSGPPKNVGASVRTRLLTLAKERGEDFNLVLTRYVNERLLYRLSRSAHASQFVLKGATLFILWTGAPHRTTRDVDLLGLGEQSEERMESVFAEVLAVEVDDDGVEFDAGTLDVGPIREDQAYGGVRVTLLAKVTSAEVRLQIDIGFGDAITPKAKVVELPALLDLPAPRLRAYPRETVVAEKLEAMVNLGLANSRMKDFYDLVLLVKTFAFDGALLVRAISATFDRRGTPLPTGLPVALTREFAGDAAKRTQWTAFLRKSGLAEPSDLADAVAAIVRFVEAPLAAAAAGSEVDQQWSPGGPWS